MSDPMDELQQGVAAIHDEANGVLDLRILQPEDVPEMLVAGLCGNDEAGKLAQVLSGALAKINAAPKRRPALCACCPRPLRNGRFAVVMAFPSHGTPTQALTFAICKTCGTDADAIQAKALETLRQVWPESRVVTIHAGGRA